MEYEVNSRPFDEHEMVDDVIEADDAFRAALRFMQGQRIDGVVVVYVREAGTSNKPQRFTMPSNFTRIPDAQHIEAVAFRLHQAAFFAQRPERASHVLAKEWMTAAFKHGGNIDDFETRVRAVQLLIHFDMFVAQTIVERERSRDRN